MLPCPETGTVVPARIRVWAAKEPRPWAISAAHDAALIAAAGIQFVTRMNPCHRAIPPCGRDCGMHAVPPTRVLCSSGCERDAKN